MPGRRMPLPFVDEPFTRLVPNPFVPGPNPFVPDRLGNTGLTPVKGCCASVANARAAIAAVIIGFLIFM